MCDTIERFKTSRDISEALSLSIITTRHYLQKFRREGYLRGIILDKQKKIYHSLNRKGVDKLNFYQDLESIINGVKM